MSERRLKLTRIPQAVTTPYPSSAFRFTVTASDGNQIQTQIFKVFNRPVDPAQPTINVVRYVGVCTPGDIQNLQVNAPPVENPQAYYLTAALDLTFDSEAAADTAWTTIQATATQLIAALDATDLLNSAESVWIGAQP